MNKYRRSFLLAAILVALVVMIGFAFFSYWVLSHPLGKSPQLPATVTIQQKHSIASKTFTTPTSVPHIIKATPQSHVSTPTSRVSSSSKPKNIVPQASGSIPMPALQDSLSGNDGAWMMQSVTGDGTCQFSNGALQVSENQSSEEAFCLRNGANFQNGTLQVNVKLLAQGMAGLVFRAQNATGNTSLYFFGLHPDGTYSFGTYIHSMENGSQSTSFSSQSVSQNGEDSQNAANTGVGASNVLKVVAQGNSFTLYVNGHAIGTVNDSTLSSGTIGVFAADEMAPASASFSDLKMWTH